MMTPQSPKIYTIDRFEADTAILETSSGDFVEMPRSELPATAEEGDVVQAMPRTQCGERFVVLRAATARERAEARARIERLQKRDPGGNVIL
jgi:hypothetical protein